MANRKGRVTIPTDLDVVPQTKEIMERWGADALRDCDGTEFPQELKDTGAKIYATYCTTRKDNAWAKANPDEVQQMYIMTPFHTAVKDTLEIHLMDHLYPAMLKVNTYDDIQRWWEVMDRTTGAPVPVEGWRYDGESGNVVIPGSRNPAHIRDNFDIFDFALTTDEMATIAALDKNKRYYNGTPEQIAGYKMWAPDFDAQE